IPNLGSGCKATPSTAYGNHWASRIVSVRARRKQPVRSRSVAARNYFILTEGKGKRSPLFLSFSKRGATSRSSSAVRWPPRRYLLRRQNPENRHLAPEISLA